MRPSQVSASISSGEVDAEATKLATEVVGSLRRRLEEDGPTVDPADDAALVEHVGAAFRRMARGSH